MITNIGLKLILEKAELRPFDAHDHDAFAGCESAEPMIGYLEDLLIIKDGENVILISDEDGEQHFTWTQRGYKRVR